MGVTGNHSHFIRLSTVHAKDYVRISAYAYRMHFTALCRSRYRCPRKSLRVSADISAYEYVYTFHCSVNVRGLYYGMCVGNSSNYFAIVDIMSEKTFIQTTS